MKIYYSGAEIPGWRRVLADNGAEHAALSFMGLRRRTKFIRPWLIREKIAEPLRLLLDSGAYTINAKPAAHPVAAIMTQYEQFAEANAADIDYALDLDVVSLGAGAREAHRERMARAVGDKLVPVWHAEDSVRQLYALAQHGHRTIALADTAADGRDIAPVLRELAGEGVAFIGLALLKPDRIRELPLAAVTGTSWLSPAQHGETVIYTGRELHRFHKKYQASARSRYRSQIEALGVDPAKVADGDTTELLALSVRSWEAFVRELAAKPPQTVSERNGDPGMHEVDIAPEETGHESAGERPHLAMPGLDAAPKPAGEEEAQAPSDRALRISDVSLRMCDNCYLKDLCREHKPGASCVYEFPVDVETRAQVRALRAARLKIQTERTLFARMAEQREGGYPNPVVSAELDRLDRMLATDHKLDSAELTISMRSSGASGSPTMGAGVISRIFGREPAAIEPVTTDPAVAQILDAELVEDPEQRG